MGGPCNIWVHLFLTKLGQLLIPSHPEEEEKEKEKEEEEEEEEEEEDDDDDDDDDDDEEEHLVHQSLGSSLHANRRCTQVGSCSTISSSIHTATLAQKLINSI